MSFGLMIKLLIMMFLQYLVWGFWLTTIPQHMGKLGLNFTEIQQALVFSVYGFGSIIGPFIIGQIADRYFATEKVLAACHFLGGILLIASAYATGFIPLFVILFIYCNLYMPTMALTNSITFRNLGDENQWVFPWIRSLGTIGWIAGGWLIAGYLTSKDLEFMKPMFAIPWIGVPTFGDCLRGAGVISIVYSFYCLFLPHTPPVPAKETDPIDKRSAALESLELMRNRSFAVLVVVAGLIGIMLAFYFGCESYFLASLGVKPELISFYMSFGQIAELAIMGVLPFVVAKLGVKTTMILGASAWALRFGLSVVGQPVWLMIATITLHGFCFAFFFVVAQMYVDRAASGDIKASAQNLLVFLVYGVGTVVGNFIAGYVRSVFKEDWSMIWAGPFALTVVCILVFALLFREQVITKRVDPAAKPQLS